MQAEAAVTRGEVAEGIRLYIEHLASLPVPDESGERLTLLHTLGDLYADIGDTSAALRFYLDARLESEETGDFEALALTLHSIGLLYGREEAYDLATASLEESLSLFQEIGRGGMELRVMRNLGAIHLSAGEIDRARECELRALTVGDLLGDHVSAAAAMITLGEIAERQQRPAEALSFYIRASERLDGSDEHGLFTTALLGAGRTYYEIGQREPALHVLEQGLAIAREIDDPGLQSRFHHALSRTFESLGRYRIGLEHLHSYILLNESFSSLEQRRTIAELQMRFDLERRMKEEELRQQHDVTRTMIQTQEVERTRIAGDLHDGVGQLMATIRIHLLRLERELDDIGEKGREAWSRSVDLLERAAGEVRTISHTLSSSTLRELGIEAALGEIVADVNSSGTTRLLLETGRGARGVSHDIALALFRVAQELILNVIRHADARLATIRLIFHEESVVLMVEDNGVGFDVEGKRHGMGTRNIEARISALGGTVRFDSQPGHGTTVTVEIPLGLSRALSTGFQGEA